MPCTPGCGACCDPVTIPDKNAERAMAFGPAPGQLDWMWRNWMPLSHRGDTVLMMCANYDIENRSCLAYDTRPPVCKDYPFYGKSPDTGDPGGRIACGFQAEAGRTVLPLVEIR
jgi:Fe-S-cluster containining protein